MNMVALIPARARSKRILHKNMRPLGGQPLIAWTIAAAKESGVFESIYCCTDDFNFDGVCTAEFVGGLGVSSIQRPMADDAEPDIVWVKQALALLGVGYNAFAILRPTSPFRTAATIQRAFKQFTHDEAHSLRAVQPAKEHPFKMWTWEGAGYALMPLSEHKKPDGTPYHSSPTQTLPKVYVQNASLEMAWTYVVNSFGTISGRKVAPFFTEGYEGFDINEPEDFETAERLVAEGKVALPALAAL